MILAAKVNELKVSNWLCLIGMSNGFVFKEYLSYLVKSKGVHSIHSPFVFDFIQNVLHDTRTFYCYSEVEKLREKLLLLQERIQMNDLGAGSRTSNSPTRSIRSIAEHASTPAKYAQLLFRLGVHYECKNILELGTSLGLTTLYLSSTSKDCRVITIEGDEQIASKAQKHFDSLKRTNITLLNGSFEIELSKALEKSGKIDLVYIDGNHRRESTVNYFKQILSFTHEKSILIFGDIHWSKGMREAWKEIISLQSVTATIDLFYLGIVFFRKELSKQDFMIRW